MENLDNILTRLGEVPLHPRLALMDEAVFAALAERQRNLAVGSLRLLSIAGIAALAIGVMSAALPGSPAAAAPSLEPFGAPPALAPSSLLLASR